jgi:signal transduction histidine kinase
VLRVSVGRRLFVLVALQTAIALLLIATALKYLSRLAADTQHMYQSKVLSIADLGEAHRQAAMLQTLTRPDAAKLGYQAPPEVIAEIANQQVSKRARTSQALLLAIGLAGTVSTLMMGLLVRRAIAPRIRRLVAKVHRFRDLGVVEHFVDSGDDEIAVLGNALDTGFSAIATRDHERDQFLAVTAHELKTPITSIHGFASVLATHPADRTIVDRAIDTISRQSWRLSRLANTSFWQCVYAPANSSLNRSPLTTRRW